MNVGTIVNRWKKTKKFLSDAVIFHYKHEDPGLHLGKVINLALNSFLGKRNFKNKVESFPWE